MTEKLARPSCTLFCILLKWSSKEAYHWLVHYFLMTLTWLAMWVRVLLLTRWPDAKMLLRPVAQITCNAAGSLMLDF
jgi:hypothetical protein